jgi:hypothetical protein
LEGEINPINILHIVTAPLHYINGDNPRPLDSRLELLSEGVAMASASLQQVFSGSLSEDFWEPNNRPVNVYHLHLYDPEMEADAQKQNTAQTMIDTFEKSFRRYEVSEDKKMLHLLGWDWDETDKKYKYNDDAVEQQKQLQGILTEHDINMVFCAGGETHWLRRRLAKTGCLDPKISAFLANKDKIVWSGFSAGAINLGTTTELCAAKNFSPLTNPKREYPNQTYDDVSVFINKAGGECKFDTNKIPETPPPDCDYSSLGVLEGTAFPHYEYKFESMIDLEQDRNKVLGAVIRMCDSMCFAINMTEGPGEPGGPMMLTNKPYAFDEQAANRLVKASFNNNIVVGHQVDFNFLWNLLSNMPKKTEWEDDAKCKINNLKFNDNRLKSTADS